MGLMESFLGELFFPDFVAAHRNSVPIGEIRVEKLSAVDYIIRYRCPKCGNNIASNRKWGDIKEGDYLGECYGTRIFVYSPDYAYPIGGPV